MYFIVFLSSAAVAPEGKQSCVTLVQSAVSHSKYSFHSRAICMFGGLSELY